MRFRQEHSYWLILLLAVMVGAVMWLSTPEYSPENPSEAHGLYYGDGECVSPEEHERNMEEA